MNVPAVTRRLVALIILLPACRADTSDTARATGDMAAADTATVAGRTPSAPAADPAPDDTLVTPDGWGPLRIGMRRAEVVAAAGEDANPDLVGGPDPEQCDEFRPLNAPEGILVMIERGVLTRISIGEGPDVTTPAGLRVGDPAEIVISTLGASARVEPHEYVEAPARYVTLWRQPPPDPARRGVRYEIGLDGDVERIHAGGPSIEYAEGCV